MANCIRGQGQAPPPKTPAPWGQTACPPHPLGNFYGLILGIALGATRGDAELETGNTQGTLTVAEPQRL